MKVNALLGANKRKDVILTYNLDNLKERRREGRSFMKMKNDTLVLGIFTVYLGNVHQQTRIHMAGSLN